MRLTGILRDPLFSPAQHGENDRLILELTAAALERRGCNVTLVRECDVGHARIDTPVVFSMCQGPRASAELARLERQGALVVNSPLAVQSCYRVNLLRLLGPCCESLAPMRLVSTSQPELEGVPWGDGACWVKRGDVHATQPGDVKQVLSLEECRQVLAGFAERGIGRAILQPHIEGTVVKFYGVVGTGFFRFYSERDRKIAPVAFWAARPAIEQIVRQVGLHVYGGDAVLTDDNRVAVIDINDWPSFANFRGEAADVIAEVVFDLAASYRVRRRSGLFAASDLPTYHSRR